MKTFSFVVCFLKTGTYRTTEYEAFDFKAPDLKAAKKLLRQEIKAYYSNAPYRISREVERMPGEIYC